ncbi:antibiotic biosynthesis monooxygenase [Sphingomonas sp. CJ99]
MQSRKGQIAVIFLSERTGDDPAGYAAAADAMDRLAARQPGYCGVDHLSDGQGRSVTISYWADDAAAIAWRDHPDHAAMRDAGRDCWYRAYRLHVTRVERSYGWDRP